MGRSHGFAWTEERKARVRALRASGMMYYQIAKQLSEELGIALTESQCSSVLTGKRKVYQPEALVKETKPTVEVRAETKEPHFEIAAVEKAPAVHTHRAENYLIISDPQLPYQHPGALRFCQETRREFAITLDNVLCVGDEFDLYFASRFEKSPDAPHTPKQEIEAGREEVARWIAAFPKMRLCYSNHGARLGAAAKRGMLPGMVIRTYREIFGLPETWQYADHWIVKASRQPFRVEHGHKKPGGHSGLRTRPLFRGMSTAWGHEHATPGTVHLDTDGQSVWGMRCGSLISKEPLPAFDYNNEDAYRPTGSIGVVLDGGRLPLVVKM